MQTILHVLAIAGVLFLFIWWGFHRRSGLLGFGYALLGSVVVLAAAFDWPLATLLAGWLRWPLLSVAVAGLLLVLLAWLLIAVTASRQAGTRSVPTIPPFPQQRECPHCRQRSLLFDYWVAGWRGRHIELMCPLCAERKRARMVEY
jgi:hypothetical protein